MDPEPAVQSHRQLALGAYVVRVLMPVVGVAMSVVLLTLAAAALALHAGTPTMRLGLFAAGGLSWILGIGWGVLANDRPLPPTG